MAWTLQQVGLGGGLLFLALSLWGLLAPQALARALAAFPRHRPSGWVLAAVAIGWSALLLRDLPLGPFDRFKGWIFFLAPLLYYLVLRHMPELLAPRALGGVLMLAAAPVLEGIRWHESSLRYIAAGLTYVIVVWGMVLVLSPFRFRKCFEPLQTGPRLRFLALGFLVLAGLLGWIAHRAG